jgi:hypothetical protein
VTDPYEDADGHGGSPHEAFDPDQMIGPDDVLPEFEAFGSTGAPPSVLGVDFQEQATDDDYFGLLSADADINLPGVDVYNVVSSGGEVVRRIAISDRAQVSDGHHTFDELYEHRRALTGVLATIAAINGDCWRSKRHHPDDGPMFDGSFIVGIELPGGPISYHYPLSAWDKFGAVPVLEHSPKWDGAGPDDTIARLNDFIGVLHHAILDGQEVQEQAREAADAAVATHEEGCPGPRPCQCDHCRSVRVKREANVSAAEPGREL